MALSEYEQRRLDEIERALRNDDPGFAGSIDMSTLRQAMVGAARPDAGASPAPSAAVGVSCTSV